MNREHFPSLVLWLLLMCLNKGRKPGLNFSIVATLDQTNSKMSHCTEGLTANFEK